MRGLLFTIITGMLVTFSSSTRADEPTVVEKFLVVGELDKGEQELNRLLRENASDQLLFELGALQFLQAIEQLGQSLYEYGADGPGARGIPFLRLGIPENPKPKAVELADVHKMFEEFEVDLDKCYRTLDRIEGQQVKMRLPVFKINLDFDINGKISDGELLGPILTRHLGVRRWQEDSDVTDLEFAFDAADVEWLRGYCCLLRGLVNVVLAYDQSKAWDVFGHRIFKKAKVKWDFSRTEKSGPFDGSYLLDVVAAAHHANFELKDKDRLKQAHQYFLQTIIHSRKMWKMINSETDDDREWIPSPKQSSAFRDVRVTRQMTETWGDFLNESEQLLKGEKLVPFWRGNDGSRGVNVHKVFHQPADFDVVLWVHGSAATGYLEEGQCSTPETWSQFRRVFQGDFFGYAAWFN